MFNFSPCPMSIALFSTAPVIVSRRPFHTPLISPGKSLTSILPWPRVPGSHLPVCSGGMVWNTWPPAGREQVKIHLHRPPWGTSHATPCLDTVRKLYYCLLSLLLLVLVFSLHQLQTTRTGRGVIPLSQCPQTIRERAVATCPKFETGGGNIIRSKFNDVSSYWQFKTWSCLRFFSV